MFKIRKKVTQVGRQGRCVTLPKLYLQSMEGQGLEFKEMWMEFNTDNSITLTPIIESKTKKT